MRWRDKSNAAKKERRNTSRRRPSKFGISRIADRKAGTEILTRQLSDALDQQSATAEVLRIIARSPGDLNAVFEAILKNSTRICEAQFGALHLCQDGAFEARAMEGVPLALADELKRRGLYVSPRGAPLDRVLRTKTTVHTIDAAKKKVKPPSVKLGGARSHIAVPMIKADEVIGALTIYRTEVRPFTDSQIALVSHFADQAVIAIENARLLNELRESLEQQTATAEVLRVVSSSPGELTPVFDSVLAKATQLCEASYGAMWMREGDMLRNVAFHGVLPESFHELWHAGSVIGADARVPVARCICDRASVIVEDLKEDASYRAGEALAQGAVDLAGIRTLIAVPMLKEDDYVGAITIYRREVKPFADKQIELVQNFAAQAVIAIENTRLLNELRQRTDDLSESLEQQTATAEVLKVISSSPGELEPVFGAILANATQICEAAFGNLLLREGSGFRSVAIHSKKDHADSWRRNPVIDLHDNPGVPLDRVAKSKRVFHSPDLRTDQSYIQKNDRIVTLVEVAGARTHVTVPMLKEDELIGAISMYREEVRPFTDKQIELVQNFAAQAVIAIENARLLNELRESLQQQTATADVLKVISSSPGELEPVFNAILENATRICEAKFGTLFRVDNGAIRRASSRGVPKPLTEFLQRGTPLHPGPQNPVRHVLTTGETVHIKDYREDSAYLEREPIAVAGVELGGIRTLLLVPMIKDNECVGAIAIFRQHVEPFTDKQIELLRNFAAQAVIAIENTRLLNELRQRTTDLSQSLEDLRTAQDRLVQTEKLASLGQLTAGIAHEIKNPLNFVNNFSAVSTELIDELQEALGDVRLNEKRRGEIAGLMDTLRGNLDKVVQHGKRADAIVKNMLLHSRAGSGERRRVDVNAIVEESLNLAYHGARAEKQGFNITLERSLDPAAGEVDVFPQEITRVLLNLISNGFYAATKRRAEANGGGYEPVLVATTKNLGDCVEIRIRDNGTGIPPEVKDKMFAPFFTTKPVGEGTGLGLSISHDIIVKQHAGSIEVDTRPGEFTEFRIILPRGCVTP